MVRGGFRFCLHESIRDFRLEVDRMSRWVFEVSHMVVVWFCLLGDS